MPKAGEGLVRADLSIAGGRIAAIAPPGVIGRDPAIAEHDADDGMVWPGFVDAHTHLDKGHIAPRRGNPDGTFTHGASLDSPDLPRL